MLDSIVKAYELAKAASKNLRDAESKQAMADVLVALAEARTEVAELQELLSAKDQEMTRLRQAVTNDAGLTITERGWYVDDSGAVFCPSCYQDPRSPNPLVRLTPGPYNNNYDCPVCGWRYRNRGPERETGGRRVPQ